MNEEYPLAQQEDERPPVITQMEFPPPVGREGFRLGDEGPGVSALQMRLGCPGTGIYDTTTEHAVRRFQVEVNLVPDGVADSTVHGRLGLPWVAHA